MRFALVQLNSLVGAPQQNAKKIIAHVDKNKDEASVFVFPELSLIGYPCRDLLSHKTLLEQEQKALQLLIDYTQQNEVTLIVGHTSPSPQHRPLYNSASVLQSGKVVGTVHKHRIPSYDIFEEDRFFASAGAHNHVFNIDGTRVGLFICEDAWSSTEGFGRQDVRTYKDAFEPSKYLKNADIVINLSASPFSLGKREAREDLFSALAQRFSCPLLYVNSVGAQDDIIFDGASFVFNAQGEKLVAAPAFQECVSFFDFNAPPSLPSVPPLESEWESLHQALVLGIKDYFQKSKSTKLILGLSGGIDSSLVACLATEALGKENVTGITLSSKITSQASVDDAVALAKNLGIKIQHHHISDLVEVSQKELKLSPSPLTLENLQVRARAMLLMTLSNQEGSLLVSTANKSEIAMGYGTLYGDLCGSLMPIGDLLKCEVYGLAYYLNHLDLSQNKKARIPLESLLRAPSAELSPGQVDEDSLPAYEKLDVFLDDYLHNAGRLRGGEDKWDLFLAPKHSVSSLIQKIHSQEFKRRQSPPVLRVHNRAFGLGWRMPLAKGFPS